MFLALAATGLVYGSLLAFRAPDIRGVIAYSSLAQMGLITIGIFAFNIASVSGAILQSVNHGLLSATLFLLAGTIERRTSTGDFNRLGGMARGRPALATVLMATGIIALAVPGSSAFAGEFLILAGSLRHRLGLGRRRRGRHGPRGDVHAQADLGRAAHRARAGSFRRQRSTCRPAELGILVPLVACLLALSAWPAGISDRVIQNSPGFPAFRELEP